ALRQGRLEVGPSITCDPRSRQCRRTPPVQHICDPHQTRSQAQEGTSGVDEATRDRSGLVIALDVPADDAARCAADLLALPTVVDATTDSLADLDAKWSTSSWDVIIAVARDVGSLRRFAPLFDSFGTAPSVVIHIVDHRVALPSPHRGVNLSESARVKQEPLEDGGLRLTVSDTEPLRPRLAVALVALPGVLTRASGLRVTATDAAALSWCIDEPDAQTVPVTRR